jgi:hypothetical protein
MNDSGIHLIDDHLREDWFDDWAGEVIRQVEQYLAKQAAFEAFLEGSD